MGKNFSASIRSAARTDFLNIDIPVKSGIEVIEELEEVGRTRM